MASSGGLSGILTRRTKSTDHPRSGLEKYPCNRERGFR